MYLSKIKLWNFRKFGTGTSPIDENGNLRSPDLEVNFNKGLNVLIGENDSGKTAIIDAIKIVLKTHSVEWIRIEDDDFYNDSKRSRIECYFSGLTDDEAKHFIEWLGFNENDNNNPYLKVILDIQRKNDRILPFDICAGVDDNGSLLSSGAKDYLKVTYLKPLRDAKSELIPKKNSRLSQILIGHSAFKNKEESHPLKNVFDAFKLEIEKYFKEEVNGDRSGVELKERLEKYLEEFFGNKKESSFSGIQKELKDILDFLKLSLEDEKMGLGSHNLLFIAAELLNLERTDWTGLRLGLIEELEAHLHPQSQMRVIEYLQNEALRNNIQWIITTHSPNLGSKVKLANIILCYNKQAFPMGSEYTELNKDDYSFLERFLDVTKANLFFAKGVIFVEGWSEELILPSLAKKIGVNLTQKGISVVNVQGIAFLHYSKIFQRKTYPPELEIPVAIVRDLDIRPDEENLYRNGTTTQKDSKIAKLKEEYDKQKIKVYVSPHWTLEYCILRSQNIKDIFIDAIKESLSQCVGEEKQTELLAIINGLEDNANENAKIIYRDIICGDPRISKSLIAQIFANKLESSDINPENLKTDVDIKYLLDAINYVTQ